MSKVKDTFFGGAEKKAGKAQAEASREAARLTKEQFEEVKARLDPFIDPAEDSLGLQSALSGASGARAQRRAFSRFEDDPGTEFLREQGLRMIDTGAASTGGLGGGDRLRELTKFSQGLALQDLNNRFNRLGAVTGTGLQAASALGGVSAGAAAGQAAAIQNAGLAKAGGITGSAQGFKSGLMSTGALLASDERLKSKIISVGKLKSGLDWCKWEWRDFARKIVGNQPPEGVIAQEAIKVFPDAVVSVDGYLRVDYSRIY